MAKRDSLENFFMLYLVNFLISLPILNILKPSLTHVCRIIPLLLESPPRNFRQHFVSFR